MFFCGPATINPPGGSIVRALVRLISGRARGSPLISLALHDVKDSRVRADKSREILGVHHPSPDHAECDHGRRADAYRQRGALADELAQAAHGHYPFAVVLLDPDLDLAAENHHHVVSPLAFLHDPGPGRAGPPR